MRTLKEIEKEKEETLLRLSQLNDQIDDIKRKTLVRCESNNFGIGCNQAFYIQDIEYIQTHLYEPPYSCNRGDNWYQGEGQFICPNCSHLNRLYSKPEITELKRLFKNVVDRYDR